MKNLGLLHINIFFGIRHTFVIKLFHQHVIKMLVLENRINAQNRIYEQTALIPIKRVSNYCLVHY